MGHRNNNARTCAAQSGETTDARSIQNERSKEGRRGEREREERSYWTQAAGRSRLLN
jgi:hypothetical protein